tara:strand:- start:87 stop:197 length:111 start_codon:yes stop_codon:yes gene_type:complete
MIDRMFYRFFEWLDNMNDKVCDVWNFDINQDKKKKK